jgi:hypothetical protein
MVARADRADLVRLHHRCKRTIAPFWVRAIYDRVAKSDDQTVRKTVSLPSSVWKQIEDYQFGNCIKRELADRK